LGIDLEAHLNGEETAETFRDLHLERSKQTNKPLFDGTLMLLGFVSGYHKRFVKTDRQRSMIKRRVMTTKPITSRSSSRLDGEYWITRLRIKMGFASIKNNPKLRTTTLQS